MGVFYQLPVVAKQSPMLYTLKRLENDLCYVFGLHRCTEWLSFNPGDVAKAKDLGCPKATLCMSCTSDCVDEAAYHNDFLFHIESDPFETVSFYHMGVRHELQNSVQHAT